MDEREVDERNEDERDEDERDEHERDVDERDVDEHEVDERDLDERRSTRVETADATNEHQRARTPSDQKSSRGNAPRECLNRGWAASSLRIRQRFIPIVLCKSQLDSRCEGASFGSQSFLHPR